MQLHGDSRPIGTKISISTGEAELETGGGSRP